MSQTSHYLNVETNRYIHSQRTDKERYSYKQQFLQNNIYRKLN